MLMLISALLRMISHSAEWMNPIPPMSAASWYTTSNPLARAHQHSGGHHWHFVGGVRRPPPRPHPPRPGPGLGAPREDRPPLPGAPPAVGLLPPPLPLAPPLAHPAGTVEIIVQPRPL